MEGPDPPKPAETAPRRSGTLAGLFGWFASSLGFIGAILYACGYLISTAQLHLLGLGRLMSRSHDYYVQEGGSFLADIGSTLAIMALPFSFMLVVAAMISLGGMMLWRKFAAGHAPWLRRRFRRGGVVGRMWRYVAYGVLLVVLLYRYGDPRAFGLPLTLSNVLFAAPAGQESSQVATVRGLLSQGDRGGLDGIFEARLRICVSVGLLLLGARFLTQNWAWRRLALAPFALMFALYLLLLPMLYGVLKSQVEFPVAMIGVSGDATKPAADQRAFLLNQDEHGVLLYLAADRTVLLRRTAQIERLDVIGMAPILKDTASGKGVP
jgi:hypothetical protein